MDICYGQRHRFLQKGTVLKPTHWVLDKDYEVALGSPEINWDSPDGWLVVRNGIWRIKAGFRWDGCTKVPDFINEISIETGKPCAYYPSLCHDIGYRCLIKYGMDFPYGKLQIDCFFLELGKIYRFWPIELYFFGVLFFGWYYILSKKTFPQDGE